MSMPFWFYSARAGRRRPTLRERLVALELNQENIMSDIEDLKTSEANLEGAVAEAVDDIHSLNAQLQSQIAANAQNAAVPEGIRAVAASLAAATARLRDALPTKANPAPEPAPQAPAEEAPPNPAEAVSGTTVESAAQSQAQADAGSVAGAGGPAPTPENLGQVTAEGDPAPGTTRESTEQQGPALVNGEPAAPDAPAVEPAAPDAPAAE